MSKVTPCLLFCWALCCFHIPALSQCEADASVYLTDYDFTPNELTIQVGETVAFINADGIHNVDGTDENNPVAFFIEESEGNIEGLCMGTVTFDVPGVYSFVSSIGVQPALGMTGSIVVDAETLSDVMTGFAGGGELEGYSAWQAGWAFNSYLSSTFSEVPNEGWAGDVDLTSNDTYTVFVPTDEAIADLMELMNLSQFDMLAFYDMPQALKYHVIPGVYLANDLQDGMELFTAEGQSVAISFGDAGAFVNSAQIIATDIMAFNGVIHIIDEILAPAGYPGATTWDVIVQSPDHTLLEQALLAEGLVEALRGQPILNDNEPAEGPFTVFAPTDDAFIACAEANGFADVQELMNSQFIDDILKAHLVEAVYESSDLFNGQSLVSYNNQIVNISSDSGGIQANTSPIVQLDMLAYNGVVHALEEVMPFNFPAAEGTCGAWSINMTSIPTGGEGWQGSSLHVFVNGNLIASETMNASGSESFSIPVDEGSRIDVLYNDQGYGAYHGFSVIDPEGEVLYSSTGSMSWNGSSPPKSIYGLNPCGPAPTCGFIEIVFNDGSYDGWYGGTLGVYSESGLEANIFFNPDFDGDGYADYQSFDTRAVLVTVDEGAVDFVVSSPFFYPNQCGYTVLNAAGDVVLEETDPNEIPPNTVGVEICAPTLSNVDAEPTSLTSSSLFPNPVGEAAQIRGIAADGVWEASILNAEGREVLVKRGIGNVMLNFSGLPPGLYSMLLRTSERNPEALRFIKE